MAVKWDDIPFQIQLIMLSEQFIQTRINNDLCFRKDVCASARGQEGGFDWNRASFGKKGTEPADYGIAWRRALSYFIP